MNASAYQKSVVLIVLMTAQAFCAIFFLGDVARDIALAGVGHAARDPYLILEFLASLVMAASGVLTFRYLVRISPDNARLQSSIQVAAGALSDVLDQHFKKWKLTHSEADVALFAIKGASISEIADLRDSAQGTVKKQMNAIYRKSGVSGRNELLSMLIEDLIETPLIPSAAAVINRHPVDPKK